MDDRTIFNFMYIFSLTKHKTMKEWGKTAANWAWSVFLYYFRGVFWKLKFCGGFCGGILITAHPYVRVWLCGCIFQFYSADGFLFFLFLVCGWLGYSNTLAQTLCEREIHKPSNRKDFGLKCLIGQNDVIFSDYYPTSSICNRGMTSH